MKHVRRAGVAVLAVSWTGLASYYCLLSGKPAFLFDPVLSCAAKIAEPFTGLRLRWDEASGALSDGKIEFRKLEASWKSGGVFGLGNNRKVDFDLLFDVVAVNVGVDVARLLLRDAKELSRRLDSLEEADAIVIPSVQMRGVSGNWTMRIRNPETPLPNVVIEEFRAKDLSNVVVTDAWQRGANPRVFPPLAVTDVSIRPYRFRKPLHCALLHTQGSGMIGLKPWSITKGESVQVSLPVEWMTRMLRPPLSYVRSGAAKVAIRLVPDTTTPNSLIATLELSITGDKQPNAQSDDVTTQAVVAYMDANSLALRARARVDASTEDEDRFVNELGQQFALVLLAKVAVTAASSSAGQALKAWFGEGSEKKQ